MANVTVTIRTIDDQGTPAPIDGVLARIFDALGTTFITAGTTGAVVPGSGEVAFSLPGSAGGITYQVQLYKAGVTFAPAPTKTFIATDPPVGPEFNTFQYTGHIGMEGVVATFVVQDTAVPTPNPVEGARIRLFSSPADTFLTELESDVSGMAELVLTGAPSPAGQEYIVRVTVPVGYYDGPTKTISVIDPLLVGETNIFDFTAYPPPAVPVSADVDMCRISGFFSDSSLRPLKNLSIIFHPKEGYPKYVVAGFPFSGEPTVIRDRIVASERRANTDKNGYIEIDLPRKSTYDVFVQGLDAPDHTLLGQVYIPDVAGIAVKEVFFPYLAKVTFLTSSLSLIVGQTAEIEVELESSNLQPLSGKEVLDALLEFTSSDPTVVTVTVNDSGKVQVTAVKAGVVTIQVARVAGSFAPRRPEVAALVIAPSAPTVTVS